MSKKDKLIVPSIYINSLSLSLSRLSLVENPYAETKVLMGTKKTGKKPRDAFISNYFVARIFD